MIITIDTEKGRVQFSKLINEIRAEDLDLAFIVLEGAQGQITLINSAQEFKKKKNNIQILKPEEWDKFIDAYKNSNL
jgi:hypothetical protein